MSFRTELVGAGSDLCSSCHKEPQAWPGKLCLECKRKRQERYQQKQREKYAGMTALEIQQAREQAKQEGREKGARAMAARAEQRREKLAAEGLKPCPRCGQATDLYGSYYCPECMAWDRERKQHG